MCLCHLVGASMMARPLRAHPSALRAAEELSLLERPVRRGTVDIMMPDGALGPHVRDQMPLYEAFTHRPMPFTLAELETPTLVLP